MGNQCCSNASVQKKQTVTQTSTQLTQNNSSSNLQQNYFDNEGKPVHNAYKRFVKPPTTVARQSYIVNQLHENDQVPDWMWANGNNFLNSDLGKDFPAHIANRRTFQEIEGRFQGANVVNVNKLQHQNKSMLGLSNKNPQQINSGNTGPAPNFDNIRNKVETKSFKSALCQRNKQFTACGNKIISFQLDNRSILQKYQPIQANPHQNMLKSKLLSNKMEQANNSRNQSTRIGKR